MNGQSFLTIAEAARKLRAGDVTSRGLVTESLERIQATQGNLHSAITIMTEEAISAAAKADSELQSGKDLGPLHGIPPRRFTNTCYFRSALDGGGLS